MCNFCLVSYIERYWTVFNYLSELVKSLTTARLLDVRNFECSLWNKGVKADQFYKLVPVADDDFDDTHGLHTGSSVSSLIDVFSAIQTFFHEKIEKLNE